MGKMSVLMKVNFSNKRPVWRWTTASVVAVLAASVFGARAGVAPAKTTQPSVASAAAAGNAVGNSEGVAEVAKMRAANVDVPVVQSFVENSPTPYRLSADDIVYLHEHSVEPAIITAMIKRGAELRAQALQKTPSPAVPQQPVVVSSTPAQPIIVNPPATTVVYPAYDYSYPGYSYNSWSYWNHPGYRYWPSFSLSYSLPIGGYRSHNYGHYNYSAPRGGGFSHAGGGFRGGAVSHPGAHGPSGRR